MNKLFKSQLFVALSATLLCYFMEVTQAFDHMYWNLWYKVHSNPAPHSMMIVSLDGGRPASPNLPSASTSAQAALVDKLVASRVEHIYMDYPGVAGADVNGDRALFAAIDRAGSRITMVNRAKTNRRTGNSDLLPPTFAVPRDTAVAGSAWYVNVAGFAMHSNSVLAWGGAAYPTLALVRRGNEFAGQPIVPDFSLDPASIPVVDASQLLAGARPRDDLSGASVFLTGTNPSLSTSIGFLGHGWVPSAALDVASSSASVKPATRIGGFSLILLFFCIALFGQKLRGARFKALYYLGGTIFLIVLPLLLAEARLISDVGLMCVAGLVYGLARSWVKLRLKLRQTSSDSGLPNIEALAESKIGSELDVFAAVIGQYEQMLATLPREHHGECARQIARRLSLTSSDAIIHDNGNGHFVWLAPSFSSEALEAHLAGLKALLSAPVIVSGHVMDTNVHFGVDHNGMIPAMSRIRSAIAASSEAEAKGKLFEEFGEQRMADASWDLSLHARIDQGLKNGDIWLAYQPKLNLKTNRISGAEALIRWNDPVRGMIPPDSFIVQAERVGRIDTITYWVLDKAIQASQELDRSGYPIQLSINLSAWMADQPNLIQEISGIVRARKFDCAHMTIEVTETFSLANRDIAKKNFASLRAMGFSLSIDDFGTGEAGLAYLSEIPCDELKLDKRFIKGIEFDHRNRTIVQGVIAIAHALGQEVVAEGVEDQSDLEQLQAIGCDLAQGYHIARPLSFDGLVEMLEESEISQRSYG